MLSGPIKRLLFSIGIQRRLSKRRLHLIDRLLDGQLLEPNRQPKRILEIGCHIGKDLVTFLKDREDLEIVGLDLQDFGLREDNFKMIIGNGNRLPFPDSYFDITTSIGVLEHIEPIESLSQVIAEIDRVSKSYVIVIPSIITIMEPHINRFYWQLKDRNKKPEYPAPLLYMSDESWFAFKGFEGAKGHRFWHLPPIINNLIIYKKSNQ
jgi:ubiquinone/menaquinone biosynthesis C-methylase UbiE